VYIHLELKIVYGSGCIFVNYNVVEKSVLISFIMATSEGVI